MLELEARNAALQAELDSTTPTSLLRRNQDPSSWLPRAPRPPYSAISPTAHHMRRLPPNLLVFGIGLRRLDHQGLGLGAGRAGADGERPYQERAGRRLWGPARRHAARVVFERPDHQAMGPVRRLQEHPHPAGARPLGICHPLHPQRRSGVAVVWEPAGVGVARQVAAHLGRHDRLLRQDDARSRRLGARRGAQSGRALAGVWGQRPDGAAVGRRSRRGQMHLSRTRARHRMRRNRAAHQLREPVDARRAQKSRRRRAAPPSSSRPGRATRPSSCGTGAARLSRRSSGTTTGCADSSSTPAANTC